MRIALGSDHRGYHLKEQIASLLRSKGHDVEDEGACNTESCDYPDFAAMVARKVSQGSVDRGILICGTGIGMAIAANKFPGVRAAPCTDEVTAEISRRHNDLNVLCLSGDMLSPRVVERMVDVWMSTAFEGGRHERRVEKIRDIERQLGCGK
jgi:ribose 5-phosphate isomerase B